MISRYIIDLRPTPLGSIVQKLASILDFASKYGKVSTFDDVTATFLLLQLLQRCFCILPGAFDLKNECLKIIISFAQGEGLKAFVKSGIGSFFS